ncbi:hypothetical protein GQ602_000280 [Ophiocordyceps camponoti-floridani]|uniref:Uncharacterized protein n=1 Tax=Ophiocordyceps camponoti-floridani TaxID=2030778 RepID=A0A8H4QBY9_9HYPO|nr:hypothetical protein GQ602_000280 [Ophiocordyceps camponoti-floridani]
MPAGPKPKQGMMKMTTLNVATQIMMLVAAHEPDPDITGIGIIIGFPATAYINLGHEVVAIYIMAFDPAKDSFPEMDSVCRPIARFLGLAPCWAGYTVDFERVFNETTLSMCDAQILAGGGTLISSFLCLHSNLSAYHWRIMILLAWFFTISHITGFASVQAHLCSSSWKRNSSSFNLCCYLRLRFPFCKIPDLASSEELNSFSQSSARSPDKFIVAMRHYLILRPALAIIVLFYIIYDICGSMFTEVCWLAVSLEWGTARSFTKLIWRIWGTPWLGVQIVTSSITPLVLGVLAVWSFPNSIIDQSPDFNFHGFW